MRVLSSLSSFTRLFNKFHEICRSRKVAVVRLVLSVEAFQPLNAEVWVHNTGRTSPAVIILTLYHIDTFLVEDIKCVTAYASNEIIEIGRFKVIAAVTLSLVLLFILLKHSCLASNKKNGNNLNHLNCLILIQYSNYHF